MDLIKRPGWRTIVVGLKGQGSLVGVVARVEYEQDIRRYCHNLKNLQVQLQNLLNGFKLLPQGGAGPPAGPPDPAGPAAADPPAVPGDPVPASDEPGG